MIVEKRLYFSPEFDPGYLQWLCVHTQNMTLFWRDNILTKLFIWLMKMNSPLIFLFTCSRAHFNHCHKKDDASTSSSHFTKTEPKYPGYLTSFGARVCTVAIGAKLTLCKSENVLISKSFTMFKSRYVSPSHQKCGLFFSACISTAALHTLGQAKHRADRK